MLWFTASIWIEFPCLTHKQPPACYHSFANNICREIPLFTYKQPRACYHLPLAFALNFLVWHASNHLHVIILSLTSAARFPCLITYNQPFACYHLPPAFALNFPVWHASNYLHAIILSPTFDARFPFLHTSNHLYVIICHQHWHWMSLFDTQATTCMLSFLHQHLPRDSLLDA